MPAPAFAYIFPTLRQLLEKSGQAVTLDDEMTMKALSIVSAHALLRDPKAKPEDVLSEVRAVLIVHYYVK